MRFVDLECVEHRTNIVTGALLRIQLTVCGNVRWRIAAGVKRDASIALAEVTQLHFIGAYIASELMNEDNRNSSAHFLVIELDFVVRGQMRHGRPSYGGLQKLKLRADRPASIVTTEPLL